jgi:hypothetical protein
MPVDHGVRKTAPGLLLGAVYPTQKEPRLATGLSSFFRLGP